MKRPPDRGSVVRRSSSAGTPPSHQLQIPSVVESDLPPNLRRLVVAKRPTLGHVVPKNSKTRRLKPESSSSSSSSDSSSDSFSSGQQPRAGGSNASLLLPQGQSRDSGRYNNPSNLRVLGGSVRGRKLESPNVYLRPMMGKVKEAVYSTLTSFGMYGGGKTTRQLDVFSGSGSVGIEGLSRGAHHCTFVDMSDDCCGACERNIVRCGFDGRNGGGMGPDVLASGHDDIDGGEPVARVVCADAFRALRKPESVGIPPGTKYDIVTLCPPYEEIVYADLLEAVANSVLVKADTLILVEYPVELGCLPHAIGREDGGVLVGVRNRRYGRTVIAMYVVNPTGDMEGVDSKPEEFISI
ncbi:hypothetical protein ACHAXA_004362 [Cyclostephanos tholiformis]|uniref:Uncharacterized protein n=1 Tax=Cyclostephanos tholiformis TaxID=382380 RepID=A0ABD3SQ74_9STRA